MEENLKSSKAYSETIIEEPFYIVSDLVDDNLVDNIWQDLDGLVSRDRIKQTACEVAASYQDASITTFVPIFVRRRTKEILASRRNLARHIMLGDLEVN